MTEIEKLLKLLGKIEVEIEENDPHRIPLPPVGRMRYPEMFSLDSTKEVQPDVVIDDQATHD